MASEVVAELVNGLHDGTIALSEDDELTDWKLLSTARAYDLVTDRLYNHYVPIEPDKFNFEIQESIRIAQERLWVLTFGNAELDPILGELSKQPYRSRDIRVCVAYPRREYVYRRIEDLERKVRLFLKRTPKWPHLCEVSVRTSIEEESDLPFWIVRIDEIVYCRLRGSGNSYRVEGDFNALDYFANYFERVWKSSQTHSELSSLRDDDALADGAS
jgi:hypothetical protein